MIAVISDMDWWIARVLSLGKDMEPTIFQNENIKLSGYYSQIYLLECCRSVEYLEVYVTALFTYLKWRVMIFIEHPPNEE